MNVYKVSVNAILILLGFNESYHNDKYCLYKAWNNKRGNKNDF